ncbi:MAG TPA: hypothetical protein DCP53_04815 [Elusimicrobia bacterium]|nr:hypothetical protein [Elusimicrobiota bacterium]
MSYYILRGNLATTVVAEANQDWQLQNGCHSQYGTIPILHCGKDSPAIHPLKHRWASEPSEGNFSSSPKN